MTRMRGHLLAVALGVVALAGCQTSDEPGPGTSPDAAPAAPTGASATTGAAATTEAPTTGETTTTDAPSTGEATTGEATTDEASTDEASTGEATETDVPSALPPWTSDPVEQAPQQAAVPQEITGARTGLHDGFDRVVLDLTGDEPSLGWFARLADHALEDPSGLPLQVEGERFLHLGIPGIDWTTESPERYDGAPVQGRGTEVVTEVVFGALFEGQQQVVLGLREDADYRVFSLSDPARIVIDVRHP